MDLCPKCGHVVAQHEANEACGLCGMDGHGMPGYECCLRGFDGRYAIECQVKRVRAREPEVWPYHLDADGNQQLTDPASRRR